MFVEFTLFLFSSLQTEASSLESSQRKVELFGEERKKERFEWFDELEGGGGGLKLEQLEIQVIQGFD